MTQRQTKRKRTEKENRVTERAATNAQTDPNIVGGETDKYGAETKTGFFCLSVRFSSMGCLYTLPHFFIICCPSFLVFLPLVHTTLSVTLVLKICTYLPVHVSLRQPRPKSSPIKPSLYYFLKSTFQMAYCGTVFKVVFFKYSQHPKTEQWLVF